MNVNTCKKEGKVKRIILLKCSCKFPWERSWTTLHLERFFLPCSCFHSLREIEKYLHRRHSQILKWPFHWWNCKAILSTKFDARRQLKYNVQPTWSNQIITVYLIGQFKPWSDMISFHCSEMISHYFTGIIFSHGFITLISTHNV